MQPHNYYKIDPVRTVSLTLSKTFQICIGKTSLCSQQSFLADINRLLLTCYKTNSSQSKDGFRNPATLKKDLVTTLIVNKKLANFHYCLKKFILDVARFLGRFLTSQLVQRHAILLLNMSIFSLGKFRAMQFCSSLAQQGLIYDNLSDRK